MQVCLQDATSGKGLQSGKLEMCLRRGNIGLSISVMFYRVNKELLYIYSLNGTLFIMITCSEV